MEVKHTHEKDKSCLEHKHLYRYRGKTKRRTSNVWNIKLCMDTEVNLREGQVMFGTYTFV